MSQISSPDALTAYLFLKPCAAILALVCPAVLDPEISLCQTLQIEGYTEEMLGLSHGSAPLNQTNSTIEGIVTSIALPALFYAGVAKYKDRSISFFKNFAVEQLPYYACMFTPALVVKGIFYLGAHRCSSKDNPEPRSTINYTKLRERLLATVMTIALSTFVMPRLYAKLKGQTHTIPPRSAVKYFAIQCIFRIVIGEMLAYFFREMRKEIKTNPTKWRNFLVQNDGSFGKLGYGLEEAFCKKLQPEWISKSDPWKNFYSKYHQTLKKENQAAYQKFKKTFEEIEQ
ncbi:MAG: hypothetical protein H7A38_01040 [Chlamydiales bacterium]|nr:hypothetical protein [Chlamydiales bacterium]